MIYFGLGANVADRWANLESAVGRLVAAGFELDAVSPLVESPALLPKNAKPEWHKPYLNLVIRGVAKWQPAEGLKIAKRIERELGRDKGEKWSPRPVDIDLISWGDNCLGDAPAGEGRRLNLPHPEATTRDFVLTPLLHLQPDLVLDGASIFAHTKCIAPIPLWMAIINLTPDSFSDGGRFADGADKYIDELVAAGVQIIDLGGESTRPGAAAVSIDNEWARLQPTLEILKIKFAGKYIKPLISVDTRNAQVAARAIENGADLINDVGGLGDGDMVSVVRESGVMAVAMHSLSVPAVAGEGLTADRAATVQVCDWARRRMDAWDKAGLDMNKIILDPGIGFGKTNIQNYNLLKNCRSLRALGLRILIGHSRKSFMQNFASADTAARDTETIGLSLALIQQGVDILRVHNPLEHQRAYLAWAHANPAVAG